MNKYNITDINKNDDTKRKSKSNNAVKKSRKKKVNPCIYILV